MNLAEPSKIQELYKKEEELFSLETEEATLREEEKAIFYSENDQARDN